MTTIVTKNSETAEAEPLIGDLSRAELAVNLADGILYTKNQLDEIIVLSRTPVGSGNVIINGDFTINQRGGSKVGLANNEYGYDRWKGDAVGLEQVVEYTGAATDMTLSWVGGGTGELNGTSGSSPITESVNGGNNFSVKVPTNATKVMCTVGTTAIPYTYRPAGAELILCQRYFQKSNDQGEVPGSAVSAGAYKWEAVDPTGAGITQQNQNIYFSQTMRVVPNIVLYAPSFGTAGAVWNVTQGIATAASASQEGDTSFTRITISGTPPVALDAMQAHWTADAEL